MLVYTIKQGDTLWQIAKEYQITLDALLAANPHIYDPNYVMPGVRINVPRLVNLTEEQIPEPAPMPEPEITFNVPPQNTAVVEESARPCIYITTGGETLYSISEEWGIPLAQLHYHNYQYTQNSQLPAGERIIMPQAHEYRISVDNYTQNRGQRQRRRR